MTRSSDDDLTVHREEVERLLGRCLLLLQRYEMLLKAILEQSDMSVVIGPKGSHQVNSAINPERNTLGTLVRQLFGSYIVTEKMQADAENNADDATDNVSFRFRSGMVLPDQTFEQTKIDLEKLVNLRNDLVHHFLSKHDLASVDGCQRAQSALIQGIAQVSHHLETLKNWTREMESVRELAAEFSKSDEFKDQMARDFPTDSNDN